MYFVKVCGVFILFVKLSHNVISYPLLSVNIVFDLDINLSITLDVHCQQYLLFFHVFHSGFFGVVMQAVQICFVFFFNCILHSYCPDSWALLSSELFISNIYYAFHHVLPFLVNLVLCCVRQ